MIVHIHEGSGNQTSLTYRRETRFGQFYSGGKGCKSSEICYRTREIRPQLLGGSFRALSAEYCIRPGKTTDEHRALLSR